MSNYMDKEKMDKDIVKLNNQQPISEFDFDGNKIKVIKYIDLKTKARIILSYLNLFFKDDDLLQNYLVAEHSFILEVTDLCTNIPILGDGDTVDLELLVGLGLWDMIYPRIANYGEIRRDIQRLIEMTRSNVFNEKSVGVVLDLAFEKFNEILQNMSDIDFDTKSFSDVISQLKSETDKLGDIFAPPTITKIKKKREKKGIDESTTQIQ